MHRIWRGMYKGRCLLPYVYACYLAAEHQIRPDDGTSEAHWMVERARLHACSRVGAPTSGPREENTVVRVGLST